MSAPRAVGVAHTPWTARHRVLLVVLQALGVIGLVVGYAGTSGTLRVSHQVVWVNVAGAALLVSGAGVVLFLTAGRRAIGRRRLGLFGEVAEDGPPAGPVPGSRSAAKLVSAATMTRYHLSDCPFVADKQGLASASAAEHEETGRRPCGVCLAGGDT